MHIVILGNGISGITTARFIRKLSEHRITVISAETDHFFSRTALMYIYMGHMEYEHTKPYEDWFWKKNRINLVRGLVESIDFEDKSVHFNTEVKFNTQFDPPPKKMSYDKLVLALGSAPNKFNWPGQDLEGVRGLYSYQDLNYLEKESKKIERAAIVGGGLIGIELAEMFHSRHIPVTMLVREENYWSIVLPPEESKMVSRHIREQGIDLKLATELKKILDDGSGRCSAVVTHQDEEISCGYVGLTAGVHPNVNWLRSTALEINRGILVDETLATNISDVYAIGDCAEMRTPTAGRRPIEAVWYIGRMMGETLAYILTGQQVWYDPGIWFNSAKFFDIEYQVYGNIPSHLPEDLNTLYWEHSDGKKSIRINYKKDSLEVVGFNLMGIRYRHEICTYWIKNKVKIDVVLSQLATANFDPEFFTEYESALRAKYEQVIGRSIEINGKRNWSSVLKLLKNN